MEIERAQREKEGNNSDQPTSNIDANGFGHATGSFRPSPVSAIDATRRYSSCSRR
jgi:hypothetical protein